MTSSQRPPADPQTRVDTDPGTPRAHGDTGDRRGTGDAASVTAVVLAGGTSRRFGSSDDDKLDADLGGRSVLAATLDTVPQAWRIIVVGPTRPLPSPRALHETSGNDASSHARITWTRETPPGGGPVAGLAHALDLVDTTWIALLAGDTPRGGRALPSLLDAAREGSTFDGATASAEGRRQPLLAIYRTRALRTAVAALPDVRDASLRALLAPLHLREVTVDAGDAHDVDTLDDLAFHRAHGAS